MALGLIRSRQCRGVLLFNNSEMMSASAVSNLLASSSNLTIMLRLLVPLKSTGVTLDTGRLQWEVIAKIHGGIAWSLSDTDGREKTKSLMNI